MNRRSFLLGASALLATSTNVPAADLLVGVDLGRSGSHVTAVGPWPPQWQRALLQAWEDQIMFGSSVLHVGPDGVRCVPPDEWPVLVNGAPPLGYVVTPLSDALGYEPRSLLDELEDEFPAYPPRSGA